MAEQTYDLTQTGAEVQAIINDANNMKGAGAQTTLTTEFVLLKDVNGQYHKILKSSFTEAIRDTLAGLLVNNDKGATINQIAAIASGDFGSVTPANLASVLGDSLGSGTQVFKTTNFEILTLFRNAGNQAAGACINFANQARIIGRLGVDASKNPTELTFTNSNEERYSLNFGCSTPSALASLLGAMFARSSADADTITETGIYNNTNNMAHMPTVGSYASGGWGTLLHFEASVPLQIYAGVGGDVHYIGYRIKGSDGWYAWKKFTVA